MRNVAINKQESKKIAKSPMMKTKITTVGSLLIALSISLVSFTNMKDTQSYIGENYIETSEGETLFKTKCSSCHTATKPEDMSKLLAPPIMGVMMRVKNGINGETEAEKRKNSIDFIVDYVQNPSADKSMLEEHAIERFKLMPSQKENVSPEELKLIANYLYDNFPPKGKKKGDCGSSCGAKCKH